eukprot:1147387-Pelagomonas_calceolata.AAC.2
MGARMGASLLLARAPVSQPEQLLLRSELCVVSLDPLKFCLGSGPCCCGKLVRFGLRWYPVSYPRLKPFRSYLGSGHCKNGKLVKIFFKRAVVGLVWSLDGKLQLGGTQSKGQSIIG